jgi:thioredoxin-like negative regulator of GroEL
MGPGPILYVFKQEGCPACALMRPVLDQLMSERAGKLLILELDIDRHAAIDGWEPRATPGMAIKVSGILVNTAEGAMTKAQLDRFVDSAIKHPEGVPREDKPRRRRHRTAPDRAQRPGGSEDRTDDGE